MRPLTFAVTCAVDAPNKAVWKVIGDFGTEHRWTRTLTECQRDTDEVRVGTVRSCRLPRPLMGRTEVRETLVEFAWGSALAYTLDGAAGPFASAESRWSTTPTSERTTSVTVTGRFRPKHPLVRALVWPFAKPMLKRLTRRVVGELEVFLTTPARSDTAFG